MYYILYSTKLSRLDNHVSTRKKSFAFASKQCPLAPKHFLKFGGRHSQFKGKLQNRKSFVLQRF